MSLFLFECQHQEGGFGKYAFEELRDPIHTLHSLFGLKLLNHQELTFDLHLELGIKLQTVQKFFD